MNELKEWIKRLTKQQRIILAIVIPLLLFVLLVSVFLDGDSDVSLIASFIYVLLVGAFEFFLFGK